MVHAHAADANLASGWGDAEEGTALGASQCPPRDDRVSLGDDLFDLEVDVRERVPPLAPLLLEAISTHAEIRVIAARVLGDEAVDRRLVPLVPDLLEKLPDERLVGFGGHVDSPVDKSRYRAVEP
jgi:hypothetical protein